MLKHTGSGAMMLIDYGGKGGRKDAENGETLTLPFEITEADIRALGDGYWQLGVTNFDEAHKALCTLTIEYKE